MGLQSDLLHFIMPAPLTVQTSAGRKIYFSLGAAAQLLLVAASDSSTIIMSN